MHGDSNQFVLQTTLPRHPPLMEELDVDSFQPMAPPELVSNQPTEDDDLARLGTTSVTLETDASLFLRKAAVVSFAICGIAIPILLTSWLTQEIYAQFGGWSLDDFIQAMVGRRF